MWYQFEFYCSEQLKNLYPRAEYYDEFYKFKKRLLPILKRYSIQDCLFLDEGEYFLLRVELDDETVKHIENEFQKLLSSNKNFGNLKRQTWMPEDDARNRILAARQRASEGGISFIGIPEGGWGIETWCEGRWAAKPDDLDEKTKKFATFMTKVIGNFTRAYLEEIDERVDDRWLLSVFIHLLLHSISEQRFEKETRDFPWI